MLYNPADPQDSCTSSFMDNYLGSVIIGVVGVFLSIFGSVMMLFGKRADGDDDAPDVCDD